MTDMSESEFEDFLQGIENEFERAVGDLREFLESDLDEEEFDNHSLALHAVRDLETKLGLVEKRLEERLKGAVEKTQYGLAVRILYENVLYIEGQIRVFELGIESESFNTANRENLRRIIKRFEQIDSEFEAVRNHCESFLNEESMEEASKNVMENLEYPFEMKEKIENSELWP